jgi:hypothetical protein
VIARWVEHNGQRRVLIESEFDPSKHARTRTGTFADMLDALGHAGDLAKHADKFEAHSVQGRGGKRMYAPHCADHGYLDAEGNPAERKFFPSAKQARQIGAMHFRSHH